MMSTNNILSPANGEPIIVPTQDVVLGLYYMTRGLVGKKGEGMIFANLSEVHRAYDNRVVELHAKVKVRIREVEFGSEGQRTAKTTLTETTVGRALLAEILPEGMPFALVNTELNKKAISRLINSCYRQLGLKDTVIFADQLMYTGFRYATRAGVSIGIDDLVIPDAKKAILESAETEVLEIQEQYQSGLVTAGERYNKVVDIWSRTNEQVAKAMMEGIGTEKTTDAAGKIVDQKSMNSIYIMADSGARGSAPACAA
jgi:DNA-directed RNA polymerase subunit beta'